MNNNLSHPKYRADIDGLRAVAILAVVFFHAALRPFQKSGFIGVDIFFVISGFLISTIILENLENESFSFTEFYARRIKRIFPALVTVLFACFAFGWFALLSDEYKQLGKHIAGGAGFIANYLLWGEAGYFDNVAETKPLLHLWSLGIEEQFYLIWPLLLWAAKKTKVRFIAVILCGIAASFAFNLYEIRFDPTATFYSPQTRFWELLGGSLLAWFTLSKKEYISQQSFLQSNVLSIAGMAILVAGMSLITPESSFPGWWATVPVLATMLIILAGSQAWPNRFLLANRFIVFIGKISFPLYLWHWPLLSLARIIEGNAPKMKVRNEVVLLAFLLAWITYRFIEKPVRFGGQSRAKVAALVCLALTVGTIGLVTYKMDGLEFRQVASSKTYVGVVGHDEFFNYLKEHFYSCTPKQLFDEAPTWKGIKMCVQSKPNQDVDIALIGDSHAEHLFLGLAEALPNKNVAYYIKLNVPFFEHAEYADILAHVIHSKSIKKVLIAKYWGAKTNLVPKNSTFENEILKVTDPLIASGKEVYLVGDVPEFPFIPNKCKRNFFLNDVSANLCGVSKDVVDKRSTYRTEEQNVIQRDKRIKLIEIRDYFCNEKTCSMTSGDEMLYRDNNHLSILGSRFIANKIVKANAELRN